MRARSIFAALLFMSISLSAYAQNSDVTVTVKWASNSYENKIELYNTANDLLMTICDDNQCYQPTQQGVTDQYGSRYDLGCVTDGNNYYIKMYDIANDGWQSAYVSVKVAGVEVINNNGSGATSTGQTIFFNVSGGNANCSSQLDTDNDGLADYLDYDDDGDGITDGAENLGEDRFECTLPELAFENGTYDAGASSSAAGTVGAVYRFGNAIQGYDVLMEITEMTNATIANIDNDTIDNPTYLQTELNLTGAGTPGVTFQFTIVNSGTTTASTEIFRINGITWDCDGGGSLKESVIYYDAAAYGTENPTSLEVTDLGAGDIQISASGLQEGPGFSTLKVLRAYYQFIGNSFSMRMQGIKTSSGTTKRQFGMSFTQCEFLDFNANSLIIITGEDFDNDGKYNHLDLDSDNDGIPDNVEGQRTVGYIAPSGVIDKSTGIDQVYGSGIQVIDTDFDNTPDVLDTDTDNDGLLDIEENGMANSISVFSDADNDGLDALFEGTNLSDPLDVNDDIDTPATSILPDQDGDVFTDGDVDYRDLFNTNPPASALLDFDGVDDYLTTESFIEGLDQVSIMAWVKVDNSTTTTTTIAGEDQGCKLWLQDGVKPRFSIKTSGNTMRTVWGGTIQKNQWTHIAGTYSNATGLLKIYINGKLISTYSGGVTNSTIATTSTSTNTFDIGRASRTVSNKEYFRGAIDEVRVFDTTLTDDQIQRMVYQEIQNNSGNVMGSVIQKDVIDIDSNSSIQWNNLIAYYPMSDIVSSRTYDYSNNDRHMSLYNITSVQEQTAPMPYVSSADGDWTTEGTWLHGDVWDIENQTDNRDWSIVRINSEVTTSNDHHMLGLIIETNESLTVTDDNEINNKWYLELNGALDLQGDSQLVQTKHSDLVTSANGKILRRQSGSSNVYWYTYMSSPVGQLSASTLGDDNSTANNASNTAFNLDMLKEGNGSDIQFTSAHNQVGRLSTRWTYSFLNGITYYDWIPLTPSTTIAPGVGYIHKGLGNAGTEQEYLFEGRPNNGTIKIAADDVDGDSSNESEPDVTQTTTMIGNPYPSAIDAYKFIDDNSGVIDGTLYFWHQWAGTSHVLEEYQGGYAILNKMAKIRAYQFEGISGGNNGSQDGTLTPKQYIPVGQSFITEVIADGDIEFNNDQRIYKREDIGESQFFKAADSSESKSYKSSMAIITLEFKTTSSHSREMAIGFGKHTSATTYDSGYDAKMFDVKSEDLFTMYQDQEMITQAYEEIEMETVVPLSIRTSGEFKYYIRAKDIQNVKETTPVFLKDKYENTYYDLRQKKAYGFSSESGEFHDRFEIVFNDEKPAKKGVETDYMYNLVYYNNNLKKLFIKDLEQKADLIMIMNMSGQTVLEFKDISAMSLDNGISISNLATGAYLVHFKSGSTTKSKKIMVK